MNVGALNRRGGLVALAALAAVGSVAVVPAAALAAPIPGNHGCMGPWVGRGQNSGSSTYWTIDLTLTGAPHGARCGTVEYRDPTCGGYLDECRLVGADIHTQENYTHRNADCAPPGRVVIRCEGNQMRYSWIGWEQVDTILHRPEGYVAPAGQPPTAAGDQPPVAPRDPGQPPMPPQPPLPPQQQVPGQGQGPVPAPGQVPPGVPPTKTEGCACAAVGAPPPPGTPHIFAAAFAGLVALGGWRRRRRGQRPA